MMRGSCLCGTVRWRYASVFENMTHCHCGMCRKAHGTPFATYVTGAAAPFAWAAGTDAIVARESSPGFVRSFCRHCGSVLPNTHLGDRVAIPAGVLDDDPGIRPSAHIYTTSQAPWYRITDDLPRHDYYPGADAPAVVRAPPAPSVDGHWRGSCLCGAVRYALSGHFAVVHNCHCSRCRKARAAAHATNGIAQPDQLRFEQGADHLANWRLPAARFFGQAFCTGCGSALPRHDSGRGIVIVPLGSLDDPPAHGADDHIHVASRAGWFTLTDDLPRYAAAPPA